MVAALHITSPSLNSYHCKCVRFDPLCPFHLPLQPASGNCQSVLCICERGVILPFFFLDSTYKLAHVVSFRLNYFSYHNALKAHPRYHRRQHSSLCYGRVPVRGALSHGRLADRVPAEVCCQAVPSVCGHQRAPCTPGLNGAACYCMKQHEIRSSARESDVIKRCCGQMWEATATVTAVFDSKLLKLSRVHTKINSKDINQQHCHFLSSIRHCT